MPLETSLTEALTPGEQLFQRGNQGREVLGTNQAGQTGLDQSWEGKAVPSPMMF